MFASHESTTCGYRHRMADLVIHLDCVYQHFIFANAAPVSKPVLSTMPQHQLTDWPSAVLVECSVENGREVTLSWYRGNELLNETNSPDNITLTLPLVVKQQDSAVYACVAANPVNNQTILLDTQELHSQQTGTVYCC